MAEVQSALLLTLKVKFMLGLTRPDVSSQHDWQISSLLPLHAYLILQFFQFLKAWILNVGGGRVKSPCLNVTVQGHREIMLVTMMGNQYE